jgi:hypothetical protein
MARLKVVVVRGSASRAGQRLRRLGRLLAGPNKLRRPADRIETAVIVSLVAAFLIAAVAAACFAGHLYKSQHAAAARLRPAVAVLSQSGPTATSKTDAARATWRLPTGRNRSGTLTAVTAPAIYYAPAGTSVRVWLNRSGEPVTPPLGPDDLILTALFAGVSATAVAGVALTLCYLLCRIVLDRHRLANWESAWAAIGPQWTSRR